VREAAGGLCVAFPGSDNIESWLHDFDVLTVKVAGVGDIHAGFWSAWQAIAPEVIAAIGDKPVILVGHSLGSSLAICAAISLVLAGKPPAAVWGFEPPRVSPGIGVRALLSKVPMHLYRNGNDIVTDVPPGWQQSALLTHIGPALLPFVNAQDHLLPNVTKNLPQV
jgi:triacylglycerol lipase